VPKAASAAVPLLVVLALFLIVEGRTGRWDTTGNGTRPTLPLSHRRGEIIWAAPARLNGDLEISALGLVLTAIIGLTAALLRLSHSIVGRCLARVYLEAIRNTPLLVQLYLFYFVIAPILGIRPFWTGVLCLSSSRAPSPPRSSAPASRPSPPANGKRRRASASRATRRCGG